MSGVFFLWPALAGAAITMAVIHAAFWYKRRTAKAELAFAFVAVGTAAMAACELWIMRCETAAQIGTAIRWYHLPVLAMIVSLVVFTRLYLRAGRAWLAWTILTLRAAGFGLNFLVRPNISFREIAGVKRLAFLGGPVSVVDGVPSPWMLILQLSTVLLIVFVADAMVSAWRRGDKRLALAGGGSILFFVVAGLAHSALAIWRIVPMPFMTSLFYIGIIAAMGYETTRESLRARELADDLRESEARYRDILAKSSEGIYRTSAEGRIVFANPATARILGYDSPEDLVNSVTDLAAQVWASPQERERLIRLVEKGGTVRGHECQFRRKDGAPIWISLTTSPTRGPDGRIIHFDGIFTNIDERKRADERLRQSEERFRALAESALVGIYILLDGKYAYVNPAMARVFGYSVAEMIGMTPREIVQPTDHGVVGENIRRRITGEVQAIQYEVKGRYRDGSTRDVEVYGTRVEIDGKPALVGTLVDITARKQVEEALTKSQRLLAETEMIGKVGGWELETETMKLTWTPEVYVIHEVDPSFEPTVENGIQFYAPASRPIIAGLLRRAIEHGEAFDADLELITARGHLRSVHATGRAEPQYRRVFGFFQDITERKKNEQEMVELRNERFHLSRALTVDEISTSLAHEINQPLGAILNNAEAARALLAGRRRTEGEFREIVEDIIQDAKRAGEVVRKVRGILKKDEARFDRLSVNPLIDETLKILGNALTLNKIALRLDLERDLPDVRGDRVRVQQVLLNLATNALDAMRDSPARTLTFRSAIGDPATVIVTVSDTGPGIPSERRESVFQPFVSSKKDGLGLGLPICRSIVEEHGGRIWVDDDPAGGAAFSFSLKAWREGPA